MSQEQQILQHLKNRGNITALMALTKFRCFRLAARINDLRNKGHNIKTTLIGNGSDKHALYSYEGNI
jgi:hypothetical protein